jgi:hypothetical protein
VVSNLRVREANTRIRQNETRAGNELGFVRVLNCCVQSYYFTVASDLRVREANIKIRRKETRAGTEWGFVRV